MQVSQSATDPIRNMTEAINSAHPVKALGGRREQA